MSERIEQIGITRPAHILLVEDNLDDVELTRMAFENDRYKVVVHHVENGLECLKFLRKEGEYAGEPTIDFILLDLNMPLMDGRQVLEELSKETILGRIPVVVLTTSRADTDVLSSYQFRCNSYVVKPITFSAFAEVMRKLMDYWFSVAIWPARS